MPINRPISKSRVVAAVAALAIQIGLGWALISGLAARWVKQIVPDNLQVFTVAPEPKPTPPPEKVNKPAGEAAPAGPKTVPKVLPSPKVDLAQPAPAATASGTALAGAGSGAGGTGNGSGAGGSGNGTGSGNAAPPQRVAGAVSDRDYPRDAGRAGGTVGVAFRVRPDGGVDQCRVIGSSGSVRLDALTCALVEQRFRYRPARDAAGQPVETTLRTSFTYGPR